MQGMRKAAEGWPSGFEKWSKILEVHGSFLTTVTPEDCGEYTQMKEDNGDISNKGKPKN